MAEPQPSKLAMPVRSRSPAPPKTLTRQGFSRAHGLRVLLKHRSCVPSGAVVPRRHDRDHPGKLAMPVRSGAPAPPKTLAQQGFSRANGLRMLLKRRPCVPSGSVCTTPLRQAPARQASHVGSDIPATRLTRPRSRPSSSGSRCGGARRPGRSGARLNIPSPAAISASPGTSVLRAPNLAINRAE
jgi:hypothetical protein